MKKILLITSLILASQSAYAASESGNLTVTGTVTPAGASCDLVVPPVSLGDLTFGTVAGQKTQYGYKSIDVTVTCDTGLNYKLYSDLSVEQSIDTEVVSGLSHIDVKNLNVDGMGYRVGVFADPSVETLETAPATGYSGMLTSSNNPITGAVAANATNTHKVIVFVSATNPTEVATALSHSYTVPINLEVDQ